MANPTRVEICCADHDHSLGMNQPIPCVNGVKEAIIELTDAEVAELEVNRIAWETKQAEEAAAKAALDALKTSAKAKLISGQPLTPEEADTLVI